MIEMVQAVLLVGREGGATGLYPLTSAALPRALLPVANKPMISYSLAMLESAGITSVFVVVAGGEATHLIKAHLDKNPSSTMRCEVIMVEPDCGSAGALRAVAPRLESKDFIVAACDVVTDCSIGGLLAAHRLNAATATLLLGRARTSPSSETKPGKAPKRVDYIGLDADQKQVVFHGGSKEKQKPALHVLVAPMKRVGPVTISTDLCDVHLYIFDTKAVTAALESAPEATSIKGDLLPALVQRQFCHPELLQSPAAGGEKSGDLDSPMYREGGEPAEPVGDLWDSFSHSSAKAGKMWPGWCGAVLANTDNYCERVNSVAAFGDVNKEVADPVRFERLTRGKLSKYDNFVPPSAKLGNRTTVGASCVLGDASVVGDKCSIKRSVLGANCSVGNNCKIVNSVLMDGVTLRDGCDIRNSVIGVGCTVGEGAEIKDCQIGHNYTVPDNADHKDETLSKT